MSERGRVADARCDVGLVTSQNDIKVAQNGSLDRLELKGFLNRGVACFSRLEDGITCLETDRSSAMIREAFSLTMSGAKMSAGQKTKPT